MKEIKMNKAFILPVGTYEGEIHEDILNRGRRRVIGHFDTHPQAVAAIHAINRHDNLVAMLESAIKTIQGITGTPAEPGNNENMDILASDKLSVTAANDPQYHKTDLTKPRAEYLQWCKDEAAEHLNNDDYIQAWVSMVTNLSQHPQTKGHADIETGLIKIINGWLDNTHDNTHDMRDFINGFS